MPVYPHFRIAQKATKSILKELFGSPKLYCIRAGYTHRHSPLPFDDTGYEDEYQNEVYACAEVIARKQGIRSVYDIGCGSGYKLMKFFKDKETCGIDVPKTILFLRQKYPDRKWLTADNDLSHLEKADLVICSDVVEHITNPDSLMKLLVKLTGHRLVISTPDRDIAYAKWSIHRLGPPATEHHCREWSYREFYAYVSQFFDVLEQHHSKDQPATQYIIAIPKKINAGHVS